MLNNNKNNNKDNTIDFSRLIFQDTDEKYIIYIFRHHLKGNVTFYKKKIIIKNTCNHM